MVFDFRRGELLVVCACNFSTCGIQTYFSVDAIFFASRRFLHIVRICIFYVEKPRFCVRFDDDRPRLILYAFHSLFDERSADCHRIFPDVFVQCLRLHVRALYIYEQLIFVPKILQKLRKKLYLTALKNQVKKCKLNRIF